MQNEVDEKPDEHEADRGPDQDPLQDRPMRPVLWTQPGRLERKDDVIINHLSHCKRHFL